MVSNKISRSQKVVLVLIFEYIIGLVLTTGIYNSIDIGDDSKFSEGILSWMLTYFLLFHLNVFISLFSRDSTNVLKELMFGLLLTPFVAFIWAYFSSIFF